MKARGFSLIELIVFILIVAIVAVGSMLTFRNVLNISNETGQNLQASQLAAARMNMIITYRLVNGFGAIVDPCATGTLAACTELNNFAIANNFTVASSITNSASGGVSYKTATVTVSGYGDATTTLRFAE